jgi:hypothetical protein
MATSLSETTEERDIQLKESYGEMPRRPPPAHAHPMFWAASQLRQLTCDEKKMAHFFQLLFGWHRAITCTSSLPVSITFFRRTLFFLEPSRNIAHFFLELVKPDYPPLIGGLFGEHLFSAGQAMLFSS